MAAPDLNPDQHQAVNTLTGPLLVLAGAGSGKTRVITFRIARLIQSGVRPDRILAVTFTNKAAKEMRERAVGLLGKRRKKTDKAPEISTFHSLCVRVLRRNIEQLGYPSEFPIYDRSDQESLARAALRDVRVSHDRLRPGDLLHQISSWKSQSVRPEHAPEAAKSDKELLAALAYGKYQDALRAAGAVDFDDLLLLTEELLDRFPEARVRESGRFDHLLIDEYQDTNGLQYRIVKRLAERHRNLCVVGDDDQSIYGWRGAEVAHILNFKNDWPEATVVRLESNYRSREAILNLANTLIRHNSTRHDKVLRPYRKGGEPPRFVRFEDETTEAQAVVREIKQRLDNPPSDSRVYPSDFAILFRTNEQPRAFEVELRRSQVPYVLVGGQSFYDRKEVRDVLAYLRVIAYPKDEVPMLRIINTPARGIGTGTVKAMMEEAVSSGRQLWEILGEVREKAQFAPAVIQRIEGFVRLVLKYKAECEKPDGNLVDVVKSLLQEIDYKSELQRLYDNPADVESRMNAIEEVVNALGAYLSRSEAPSLRGFLEEMALSNRDDLKEDDDKRKKEAVTLMTLHSAKGLEFPHVYMVGMEEGILPHQRSVLENLSVDEERRLAYVGVTRAKDTLTLTFCKGRMKWGKLRVSIPSRFIMEMRGETERAQRAAEASRAQFLAAAEYAAKIKDKANGGPKSRGGDKAKAKGKSKAEGGGLGTEAPLRSARGASKRPKPVATPASQAGNDGAEWEVSTPPPGFAQETSTAPPGREVAQEWGQQLEPPSASAAAAADRNTGSSGATLPYDAPRQQRLAPSPIARGGTARGPAPASSTLGVLGPRSEPPPGALPPPGRAFSGAERALEALRALEAGADSARDTGGAPARESGAFGKPLEAPLPALGGDAPSERRTDARSAYPSRQPLSGAPSAGAVHPQPPTLGEVRPRGVVAAPPPAAPSPGPAAPAPAAPAATAAATTTAAATAQPPRSQEEERLRRALDVLSGALDFE